MAERRTKDLPETTKRFGDGEVKNNEINYFHNAILFSVLGMIYMKLLSLFYC